MSKPEPQAQWGDPRVQTVYELLCSNEAPPPEQHWEGWLARRIVDALTAATAAQPEDATRNLLDYATTALEQIVQERDRQREIDLRTNADADALSRIAAEVLSVVAIAGPAAGTTGEQR